MRLIDADALREHMYHEAFETDSDLQKWDSGCWIRYQMFENILDTEITIQTFPVWHGHWEEVYLDHRCAGIRPALLCCSECYQCATVKTKYCPNCGAKMDR